MRMKYLVVVMMAGLFFTACTKHSDRKQDDNIHQHDDATPVKLNNGERWEANKETTEGINNMISLITTFQDQQSEDYAMLKGNLQVEFQTIFQKCTMKGEAHDQLHNFLIPVKKELDELSAENLNELNGYLKTYSNFFQ
jgi:hypothetical protein